MDSSGSDNGINCPYLTLVDQHFKLFLLARRSRTKFTKEVYLSVPLVSQATLQLGQFGFCETEN